MLPLFLASLGGLAYFGFLGLFLGPVLLAVVLVTFAIYKEEYQQHGSDIIIGDTRDPREHVPTAHNLADKTV
jgi:predicted PurR-regulated permease PerM